MDLSKVKIGEKYYYVGLNDLKVRRVTILEPALKHTPWKILVKDSKGHKFLAENYLFDPNKHTAQKGVNSNLKYRIKQNKREISSLTKELIQLKKETERHIKTLQKNS